MPAKVTATFVGNALRYDDVPIVSGAWSINVDTTQLANSTAQSPTTMEIVPTDAAGNIGTKVTRAFVVANAVYAGTVPALVPENWRVRSNSTRVAEGDGLRITAVAAGANADVDNNVAGKLVHVTAGASYTLAASLSIPSGTSGSRVAQLGIEWLAMGGGEDGFGGAGVGTNVGKQQTLQPGTVAAFSFPDQVAPAGAARARIILRLQHITGQSEVLVGDSLLVRALTFAAPTTADTTPPVATFSSPAGGSTVMGVTTVSGTYSDPA